METCQPKLLHAETSASRGGIAPQCEAHKEGRCHGQASRGSMETLLLIANFSKKIKKKKKPRTLELLTNNHGNARIERDGEIHASAAAPLPRLSPGNGSGAIKGEAPPKKTGLAARGAAPKLPAGRGRGRGRSRSPSRCLRGSVPPRRPSPRPRRAAGCGEPSSAPEPPAHPHRSPPAPPAPCGGAPGNKSPVPGGSPAALPGRPLLLLLLLGGSAES